jgi:uncharacterized protein YndB with AHSA1/START domain
MEPAIRKNITIGASPDRVWRTLTNTALMAQWLSDDGIAINTTWELQTTITFTGTWHHGGVFNDKGIVLKFEEEKILQYSYYSSISKLPDITESYLVITFRLTPSGQETVLDLTTENIHDYATYGHWNFYWTVTLEIIKRIAEDLP